MHLIAAHPPWFIKYRVEVKIRISVTSQERLVPGTMSKQVVAREQYWKLPLGMFYEMYT